VVKGVWVWAAVVLLCAGCNPYAANYQGTTAEMIAKNPFLIRSPQPRVIKGTLENVEADGLRLSEDGYAFVGRSYFMCDLFMANRGAVSHGEKLGAAVIVSYVKYSHTETRMISMTLPDIQTTYSTYSGTVWGPGGSAVVSGSGTSTTYGTKTVTMPMTEHLHHCLATYWLKSKEPPLGVIFAKEMSEQLKRQMGSDKGAEVYVVRKGSPASHADILRGDVLIKIGRVEIPDSYTAMEIIKLYAGKSVSLQIVRNGATMTKEVELRPCDSC
jgi:hypothetical protein